jgi:cyanate lyase
LERVTKTWHIIIIIIMLAASSFARRLTQRSASTLYFFGKPIATTPTTTIWKKHYSSVNAMAVAERVQRVLAAKDESGLSYDELAQKIGVTNTYCAQLLLGQAKLSSSEIADKLAVALPSLSSLDLQSMQQEFPMRSFNEKILQEPNVYRTYEAVTHYGEAIKSIINEQCGDGIMSAIDFYCDVGTTTGKHGEKRVVITFNGKFLPFIEQSSDDNTAKSPRD